MRHGESFEPVAGYRIYHRSWLPETAPKAHVLLVHGLAEHCARYDPVASFLGEKGYAVHGFDFPGHGRSSGRRVYARRFGELTDVLGVCARGVMDQTPSRPLFLYAHSMGALVAASWLASSPIPLSGAVLSGPCVLVPTHVNPVTQQMARALSRLMPWCGVSAIDAQGISRDPEQVRKYTDDPLVYHGKTTARLAAELMAAIRHLSVRASGITVPCLILHGGSDPIVDPESAHWLFREVGSEDKQIHLYEALYHELHNEPERATVLEHIVEWMNGRLAPLETGNPSAGS